MWQKYLNEGKVWNWKFLLFCFHPTNMLIWPLIAACNPNPTNLLQLEVLEKDSYVSNK
jgi:hypothetical protein